MSHHKEINRLDQIWQTMSSADRIVILGHDRRALTPAEKVALANVVTDLAKRGRISHRRARRASTAKATR